MKVAAYIRVSTQMQVEEGYSLSAQKEKLKAFAFSQNWEIVQFYVDEGISAKDMNRPELQRMMKGVKEKLFDIVLVYKLDRLTRSVSDLDKILKTLNEHDVKFKSATELYETTTATGRLFIRLVASMAQWERENLGERVRMGMEEKARSGKWVINISPFGYDKEGDKLLINEVESAIVKEIYDLYLTGKYGVGKIASILNDRKIRTTSGSEWGYNNVHYILKNPLYIGTMRHNYRVNKDNYFEIENVIPQIIKEEEFDQVQKILDKRSTNHPRSATSPFIFSGVLRCSRCGSHMAGKYNITKRGDKKYTSLNYYCGNQKFKRCDQPLIAQNYLEHQFLQMIRSWDDIQKSSEVATSIENDNDNSDRINSIKKELSAIGKRKIKWQYGWAEGMLNDIEFKQRKEEEEEKEKVLLAELETLDKSKENINHDEYIDILSDIRLNWNHLDAYQKKISVQILFKSITVNKAKKITKPESVEIVNFELN
ncbi:recombinase family protein [Niallia sp. 03190]|uniref:recombinase family protein n=1 Tax=Niallia sp. 03190 TaxID=3458061 RepID=UPI0040448AEF